MQYIHYHNDFTVPINLVAESIPVNADMINSITFHTRKQGNIYCCCWDCKTLYKDEDYIYAVLNGHNLEPGVLNYMVEYQIPDSNYPDGFQKVCQHYTSDIELTTQNGDITVAEAQIIYGDTIRGLLESAGYSYTKAEVDDMIAQLDLDINTYSKAEIDEMIANVEVDAYTKSETDTLLDGKADSNSVYTKTESDNKYLTAQDISELANRSEIPTKTSQLQNDSSFISDARYVHTDNNYTTTEKNKLSGIASGAEVNVQSDWNVTNISSDAYIKNKPTIPTVSTSITGSNQTNPVQGGAIYDALQGKADYKEYNSYNAMNADSPVNGTIGFESDNEEYYIYDGANDEWRRIDQAGEQSNWNETDTTSMAYIQNKPIIPSKVSDLTNDSGFITDANYVHTDNNYTTAEKTKLSNLNGKQVMVIQVFGVNTQSFSFKDEDDNTVSYTELLAMLEDETKEVIMVYNETNYDYRMPFITKYQYTNSKYYYFSTETIDVDSGGTPLIDAKTIILMAENNTMTQCVYLAEQFYQSPSTNVGFGQGFTIHRQNTSVTANTAILANYSLTEGGIIVIKFNSDVPQGATLNINSQGAKPIYYRNSTIVADVIKAGDTVTFMYHSNKYYLISNDRWGLTT